MRPEVYGRSTTDDLSPAGEQPPSRVPALILEAIDATCRSSTTKPDSSSWLCC
jgi:hypothetical protein